MSLKKENSAATNGYPTMKPKRKYSIMSDNVTIAEMPLKLVALNNSVASFQRDDGRILVIGLKSGEEDLFKPLLMKDVKILVVVE